MLLSPKKTKFRKVFKGRVNHSPCEKGSTLSFGEYGLKAKTGARVTARQMEAVRKAMSRILKKKGKIINRIFPDVVLTQKPAETRMGGGKGSPETWCALVRPGKILFEVIDADYESCCHAFALASAKLPMRTFITRSTI